MVTHTASPTGTPVVSISRAFVSGLLVFLVLFVAVPSTARAQEDEAWAKMLEGFKDPSRQYFDTALEYLEWMKTSPICPRSLKKQMDYQIAMVHLDAVEMGSMFLTREEHMKRCRESLEKYIKENPTGELAFEAQSTLGRLFMEEGRILVMKSEHESTKAAEREPLRLKAREEFKKAQPYFEAADKLATEEAKKLQARQKANAATVKDDVLYAAYGRFLAGKILIQLTKSDIAKTYPKGSKEFKDGLTGVAKAFQDLASKYGNYAAGFEAKLYAAKAYKDLGDFKTTRSLLGELNVLQGDEFLKIRSESLLMALEMNLTEKKPENYQDSINRARAWNDNAPAASKISRDGQRIFLLGAKNFIAYAETVKNKKTDYDRAIRDAGVFLRQVRPTYPNIAREATELLRQIGAVKIDKGNPENYEQAKEFADDDWKDFVMAFTEYQEAKGDDREKLKKRIDELGGKYIKSANRAINMKEEGTPMVEINAIRLNLVRAYWFQGKLLEAAILADYLTRRYSGAPDADKTAVMAIQLYRQEFVQDKLAGHDPSAIAARLSSLSHFILNRWEGQEVTGAVKLLQIETAIDNGDIEEAKKLLATTEQGTPQRISAELKIGQSLWNRYAALSRLPEGADDKPEKSEMDALLAEARKQLEIGLNGKDKLIKENKAKADAASVQCALALGQICLNAGENDKAIQWLTNPQVGPIALATNPPGNLAELVKNLQLNATMFVLRAYVGSENLDKAEETMNRLEEIIKAEDADESRLTQIYVSLGRQLENRLKELNEAGEMAQAEKVANGFEMFLKRIRERGEANTFQSLYWVADTFYRLGSGMSTERTVPEQARGYYRAAAATYVDILKRVAEEEDWAPGRAEDTIKVRLAESLRCIGLYKQAMDYLDLLLQESESRIDIQIEAAKALEAWGKEDPSKLVRAVAGGFPSRIVWGWNGLIKRTSTNVDRFAEIYYEAYLSKFRCSVEIARGEKDKEKRDKLLGSTDAAYMTLIQTRPQLGGQEWYARFDQVYKSLERAKGTTRPGGLKDLLKRIGEEEAAAQIAATEGEPEPSQDEAGVELVPEDVPKKPKAKKAETKKSSADSNLGLYVGLGVVVVFVPVAFVFVFGKKKKKR